jgi:hypothetical protein
MKVFIVDADPSDPDADAWGPYSEGMARKILPICEKAGYPDVTIVAEDLDEYCEKIEAGLQPFRIHVDIIAGEPQLPATVSLTWPPAEQEGIQEGTPEGTTYFVWAKSEKDALLRLARLNKATPKAKAEAA